MWAQDKDNASWVSESICLSGKIWIWSSFWPALCLFGNLLILWWALRGLSLCGQAKTKIIWLESFSKNLLISNSAIMHAKPFCLLKSTKIGENAQIPNFQIKSPHPKRTFFGSNFFPLAFLCIDPVESAVIWRLDEFSSWGPTLMRVHFLPSKCRWISKS